MKVLFDTNVLASAFTSLGLCHEIYERTLLTASMVSCDPLLDELRGTLIQKMKVDPALADEIIAELRNESELVEPKPLPKRICRDADDDLVLATAREAKADVIVTGDKDLLVLKKFQNIRILSPRQFIEMLDTSMKE
ncbi:MAG: putative toxin-antitoxin system toxin component, PIN family [Verrucomicrobiota bacterium]